MTVYHKQENLTTETCPECGEEFVTWTADETDPWRPPAYCSAVCEAAHWETVGSIETEPLDYSDLWYE